MTLGETREQISNLDNELSQLKAEKHQLFLQLKKVLNEDDRRRQLIKETRFASQLQCLKKHSLKNRNYWCICIISTFFIMKFFQCLFGSFDNSGRISRNRSESGTPTIISTFTTQQQSSLQGYCWHTDASVTECEWNSFSNFIDIYIFFSVNYEVNFFFL